MTKTQPSDEREFAEEQSSLFKITLGPLAWALHFVASYAAAAVWCAKGPGGSILPLRLGIGAMTAVALGLILWVGWRAWQQWDFTDDWDYEHARARGEDRHEFLGHAAFLLAIVSFVGTCYTALPALYIGTCR